MTRAYLALVAICIIWGTTYSAIKFAVRDFPPYMLVGIRQTTAGLILLGLALASGRLILPKKRLNREVLDVAEMPPEVTSPLNRRYVLRQVVTGLFTITGGNGFITWGLQYVSTGLSAVIGSLTPVVVLLINLIWHGGERVNTRMVSGVLLGFVGLGLIFSEGWKDFANPQYAWGIVGCFGSCLAWSLGTVMAKRYNAPGVSPLLNAGLQITAGGLGGFVLSAIFDKTHVIQHTTTGWFSMIYLITIGSALAFTLYMFVLQHLSATVSSLYTYINPVVAVLLGWLWLGEPLTWWTTAGMTVTIVGVWLVNEGSRRANSKGAKGK
jgi:drug/metabolite transporter (DMT)-like permease